MESKIYEELKTQLNTELSNHILPYWIERAMGSKQSGFAGRIDGNNILVEDAPKSVILGTRMLWTFASAYRIYGNPSHREVADSLFHYIEKYFWDETYGGLYWMITHDGKPQAMKKHTYAQSFAIYAYSEYNRATGNEVALQKAVQMFKLLEKHSQNYTERGYYEAFDRQWYGIEDVRLSNGDDLEARSMNTHLHVLEALTNLTRVWADKALDIRMRKLMDLMINVIYNSREKHFQTFFTELWEPTTNCYSYGHDIEAAWLILEAVNEIKDQKLVNEAEKIAVEVAYSTLHEGVDHTAGGIYNGGAGGQVVDTDKQWWAQAEAIVGFCHAYKLNGDIKFLVAAKDTWDFISKFVKDHEHGEWFFQVNKFGVPYHNEDKAGPWKCPYHTARACFELTEKDFNVRLRSGM
ncbi:MAG: AGE family epimerase/isomerase [Balneolales bacterium]